MSCADHRVQQPRRDDQPAQPQRRGQALARRAGVDDVIGGERLQRADRLPVVAELPVVVILDHHPAPAGPRPARRCGCRVTPERELMRRGQQRRVRPVGRADHGAAAVDGQRPQAQAAGRGEVAVGLVAVGLHGERGRAGRAQRGAGDGQAVREARADHDAGRVGGHAPGPGQVAGQDRPQLAGARAGPGSPSSSRGAAASALRAAASQAPRGKADRSGDARRAGRSGARPASGRAAPARAGLGGAGVGDRGPRAGPGGQPALRDQLAVDLGHRVAGQAEIGGQGARGGQPRAGAETAGPDGVAQRRLQAEADPGPGQIQMQIDTPPLGPCFRHGNGPYPGPACEP